jgi:hypothetical protein
LRARGVRLADGERIDAEVVIVALRPSALLPLLPDEERRSEPYWRSLVDLTARVSGRTAAAHTPGRAAERPRVRTPVEGLLSAHGLIRTGLPLGPESAVRAADEAAALVIELAARPPTPRPSATESPAACASSATAMTRDEAGQPFVPLGRLSIKR